MEWLAVFRCMEGRVALEKRRNARSKFVEGTALMESPSWAHESIAHITRLYRSERQHKLLSDAERQAQCQAKDIPS